MRRDAIIWRRDRPGLAQIGCDQKGKRNHSKGGGPCASLSSFLPPPCLAPVPTPPRRRLGGLQDLSSARSLACRALRLGPWAGPSALSPTPRPKQRPVSSRKNQRTRPDLHLLLASQPAWYSYRETARCGSASVGRSGCVNPCVVCVNRSGPQCIQRGNVTCVQSTLSLSRSSSSPFWPEPAQATPDLRNTGRKRRPSATFGVHLCCSGQLNRLEARPWRTGISQQDYSSSRRWALAGTTSLLARL